MVRGLAIFKEYFEQYPDNYVIIGGTARIENGSKVDAKHLRKHKSDVFRLIARFLPGGCRP